MPLSKGEQAKYQKERRRRLKGAAVIPNTYLAAHIKAYPQGFNLDLNGIYRHRADYDPNLDPFINPLVRSVIPEPLPNSPDGRYHLDALVIPNLR